MQESGESDAELIERSLIDPAAFGLIFDRHAVAIHRYLGRRLGSAAAGEQLTEVFRLAFERRASYRRDRPAALPWLYGIAANVTRRHRVSESRWARGRRWSEPLSMTAPDGTERSDERLDAEQRWARAASFLRSLGPEERETLLLFSWEQLSYAEIAEALGVPVGTVRSRLNRARTKARQHLKADGGAPDGRAPDPSRSA